MNIRRIKPRLSAVAAGLMLMPLGVGAPHVAAAQQSTAREVVQPLPSPEIQRLNRALLELARQPGRVAPLLEAGDASLALEDFDAAMGFFARAAEIDPNDAQVKLGLGRVYLRSGRPVEAIPFLDSARAAGASPREVLGEQALAFDLVGDQPAAQAAYLRVLEQSPQDDEARRRLALSYAISGNEDGFQTTLAPLIEARDVAAFRVRAFGLAIMGEQERAEAIVGAVMPRDLATRINPYLAYMPRLTAAQQAAAANLGIFPRAADIGREDPRIARFAREGAAGSRLEPVGQPLGAPVLPAPAPPQVAAATVPTAATPAAQSSAQPVPRPGFDLVRGDAITDAPAPPLPQIATTTTRSAADQAPPQSAAVNVADAFADLGGGELPVAAGTGGAVNIAEIEIPREVAPPPPPPPPAHPSRIWVQVATGRDVDALRFDWRRMTRQASDLLGKYEPHVTPWGQANRLLAGPISSRDEARDLVKALAEQGLETFSYVSPEGTEIQKLK
ncbi:tetratricopeptide repeat protein [Qipengyuania sp. ASV99]|uniref:SPOR domain-containing protein n=1 Tax=Qipengyuania sp. ASV99 TaxID=3399681 RepID=UPI003A4C6137